MLSGGYRSRSTNPRKGETAGEAFFIGQYIMHYYKHHIGDFRSGTANMTRQERWLYRDMLDVYYDKEQPLPLEVQDVADQIGGQDCELTMIAKILRLKFSRAETGWVHERCEQELETYRSNAEKARENGQKGGRPRKNNPSGSGSVASGLPAGSGLEPACNPEQTGSKANHKPLTTNHKPVEKVQTNAEPDGPAPVVSIEVKAVFEYWQDKRGHEKAKLDEKRKRAIKARLKDGYSVEDLCKAVDGIAKSSHHMGQNEQRTVYDDIELICRTAVNVDKFIKLAGYQQFADPGLQRQVDILQEWMEKP